MTAMAPTPPVQAVVALALLFSPCSSAIVGTGSSSIHKSLRLTSSSKGPVSESVVQPLRFKQEFLVCNAYPSDSTMTVKQNGQLALKKEHKSIAFQGCEHISNNIHPKDKLDVEFQGTGISGSFEIGELPDTDAMLLLVVEKRDATTPLVAFQSFAFPSRAGGKDAQLAVIDTYKGNSSSAHLRMEDHITGKEQRTVSKRVEQLNFNRIYAVEEGAYDASISDNVETTDDDDVVMLAQRVTGKRVLQLSKRHNYVILRTGDDQHFPQSLVVFPPALKSSATTAARTCLTFLALALTVTSIW